MFFRLKCAGLDFLRFPHGSRARHISGPRHTPDQEICHLYVFVDVDLTHLQTCRGDRLNLLCFSVEGPVLIF